MTSVRYEVRGSTATLTLDNPAKRNAITEELIEELSAGLAAAERDDAVRAIVLTHTGGTFCAGADLSAQGKGDEGGSPADRQRERARVAAAVNRAMLAHPKPIIGAINGHVRAGGMGLVSCCDFVVAGPRATFGLSEVRIGVVAAMIGPSVLARLGDRVAAEWMLRGGAVSAAAAAAAGFVTRAVSGDAAGAGSDTATAGGETAASDDGTAVGGAAATVDEAVEEILADLRLAAPHALAASKRLVNRGVLARFDRELDEMIEVSSEFFLGDDAQAGMRAFLDKQAPPWVVTG